MGTDLFRRWNFDRNPLGLPWVLLWGFLSLAWALTYMLPAASWLPWLGDVIAKYGYPFLVGYFWTTFIGGGIVTFTFVEFNRWLFSQRIFLPYATTKKGEIVNQDGTVGISHTSQPKQTEPQLRRGPRIEPIVLGFIERTLFFIVAAIVISLGGNNTWTVVIALAGAYIAIKSIKRVQATSDTVNASIHSIWGTIVTVGFGIFGAWVFCSVLD